MTQGVAHQQQTYAASPGNTGSAEQQNLPSINNLIHPPQHDGATQSHPAQEASNTPAAANAGASNPQHHTQHHTEHHTQQHTEQHTQHHAQQHTEQHAQHHAQHHTQQLPQAQAVQQQPQIRQTKGKYSLADFELQRTLGTGSFGRVHLVQSKHNQRFYAIKVLKKAQVVKMKQVEHTNDERRMLQEVKHPFLITLWGTFQDSKNLYMVMDFVEGGELFSLLRKSQVGGF
jgi:protein kinase A